jgi:tetratricopeptide (TPR) repeat protein
VYRRRLVKVNSLFDPVEMSQAAQYAPAGPDHPAARPRRTRLLLVPVGIALLLVAIPCLTYAFANNQLSQAQTAEAHGAYSQALSQFATAQTVAGNPVSRVLLGDLADRAKTGTAETHFLWGVQLTQQGKFADSETQLRAAIKSGIADWAVRGNAALADLFHAWGQSLVASDQFQAGIDKYHQVAAVDPTGNLTASTNASLAAAYAGFAKWYLQQQPVDYPNALIWYESLVKEFPDSPDAKLAQASSLPQTLFNAGTAFVQQMRFQQARDAMTELVQTYPTTTWATQANAALRANQPLSGLLIVSDQNPTPVANRLVRIASHWTIVRAHTYDDQGGHIYQTTTDAKGNFSIPGGIPPGPKYLITWWDPTRSTFVTTFLSDNLPVNLVTVNPLEPAHTIVATS